ncbi:MAG: hypothetical protein J5685_07655 [Clostridiales bacterium]|nr:hypothetical protein [Clostridiales bacterium]
MGTLTRLASTLTAKYFPSQTLTDAFYIDGRLFGKRETRQADITIDKEERGFFLSVFAHPKIPEYEPGMMPPYEPQLRGTCNEVKFGRKEIDGMIEGFLSTAVDVTGKMKLTDGDQRSPYFSGVIVRDAEAFAVTIGSGLAFLYRDDTLFPLTDAGIPMEPIDSDGNRVADFNYYCSSKTANALWSNFFTLSPDDCIILCNKEVYDALGQRELLRILAEAEDQCDAAGVIITQASARMPNTAMQFSISFVESVTSDEKRGLFGFRKKNKEEDTSEMSIKSTLEGGVVGAAAESAADAGFTGGLAMTDSPAMKDAGGSIVFGDSKPGVSAPSQNQPASSDSGFVLSQPSVKATDPLKGIEFPDTSVKTTEMTPEEVLRSLMNEGAAKSAAAGADGAAGAVAAGLAGAEAVSETAGAAGAASVAAAASSPFVSSFNPFDTESTSEPSKEEPKMETVSATPFSFVDDGDASKTKPVLKLDLSALEKFKAEAEQAGKAEASKSSSGDILGDAVKELEGKMDNASENGTDEKIVFASSDEAITLDDEKAAARADFDPYSVGSAEEMKNAAPIVFGDDASAEASKPEEASEAASSDDGIPVPEFEIKADKPEIEENDKLGVDFPATAPSEEIKKAQEAKEASGSEENGADFTLPFGNTVDVIPEEPAAPASQDDIPDMPVYDGNTFDTPADQAPAASGDDVYSYGQYMENENMASSVHEPQEDIADVPPYQPYGGEGMNYDPNAGYASDYQPGQYQQPYTPEGYQQQAPQGASDPYAAPAVDTDWIDSILGIDNENADPYDTAAAQAPAGQAPASSYGQGNAPVYGSGAPKTGSAPRASIPFGLGGSGNGGSGNGRKIKINRNGYIFIAFVIICLVLLIVLISAIVKGCKKDEDISSKDPNTTVESTEETDESAPSDKQPAETTPVPQATVNPSAPIGRFHFSTHDGFRTWYDLFRQVYNVEIGSEDDSRVAMIISYNGLPEDYTPSPEDAVLLPPVGVLDGSIDNTFVPGGVSAPAEEGVSGQPQLTDGGDTGEAGETSADGGEETEATDAEA